MNAPQCYVICAYPASVLSRVTANPFAVPLPMAVLHQLREVIKYGTFLEQMTNPTGLPWRRNRVSAVGIQGLTA